MSAAAAADAQFRLFEAVSACLAEGEVAMFLSAYHFAGNPPALAAAHDRLYQQFPPGSLDLHVCVLAADGITVFDACPSREVFEEFSGSARNPLGSEYGDALSGWACEHALTRTVRDSAVLLDATAGPALGDPCGLPWPARPFAAEVGRDPGRLRIGYSARTFEGTPAHPDCGAALDERSRSAHRWVTSWSRPTCRDSPPPSGRPSGRSSAPPRRGSSATGSAALAVSRPTTSSSR